MQSKIEPTVETKLNIVNLTKKLEQILEVPDKVRIHMTGCPNSCGQVWTSARAVKP